MNRQQHGQKSCSFHPYQSFQIVFSQYDYCDNSSTDDCYGLPNAVINLTLDQDRVEEKEEKTIVAQGKDLRYLLFSWLEEGTFVLITEGFAIKRIELEIQENNGYKINAKAYGEPLDFLKHNFKVEIKAPTFYEMKIEQNDGVFMRFLLDL